MVAARAPTPDASDEVPACWRTATGAAMNIADIMTRDIEFVDADDSLQAAARLMRRRNVGFVPVVEDTVIVGLITDRDVTVRAVAEGLNPNMTCVRRIMTPRIWRIYEDQSLAEAAQLMRDKKVRRLIVLDRQDRPAGILTMGDLAAHGDVPDITEQTLRHISQPAHPAHLTRSELQR